MNGNPGADLIQFNIPAGDCSAAGVCSIVLSSGIDITDAVTIDGTTQPRYGSAPANTCATGAGSVAFSPWMTIPTDPCPHVFTGDFEIGSTVLWSGTVN